MMYSPERWGRIAGSLLIGGAVLSTATQLRFGPIPFGPGEALILLGVLASLGDRVQSRRAAEPVPHTEFLVFWLLAAALFALGAFSGSLIGADPGPTANHDRYAYLFVAVFCVAMESSSGRNPTHGLLLLVYAATVLLLITGLSALLAREIAGMQLWYQVIRLRGFSDNPNQLALLAIALPFLCWQMLHDDRIAARRLTWLVSMVVLGIGILTWSDALIVSWCAAMIVTFSILAVRRLRRLQSPMTALMLIAIATAVVSALLIAGVLGWFGSKVLVLGQDAYESADQGSVRLALWRNAIEALWQSRMLGLGPGAHAGLLGPFERLEAHNMFLDWGAASGIGGLVLLCAVLCIALLRCVSAAKWHLVGALIGLTTFGVFHHTLRQPLFWCCLIAISYYAKAEISGRQGARLESQNE